MMSNSILIVEDNLALADINELILSTNGYEVAHSRTQWDLESTLQDDTPNIILLDLNIPGPDLPLDLIRKVQSWSPYSKIILTSGDTKNLQRLSSLADRALQKPYSISYFLDLVRDLSTEAMVAAD